MIAAILGLGGILWRHMVSCSQDVAVPLAVLIAQVKSIQNEIGNHDSGMVAQLHRYSKDIRDLTNEVRFLKEEKE